MIYFVEAVGYRRIKIGFTNGSPSQRLAALQIGSPVKLTGLALMAGEREDEAEIHSRFSASRSHGEWFYTVPSLMEFIGDNTVPWIKGDCKHLLTPATKKAVEQKEVATQEECARWMKKFKGFSPDA